MSRQKLQYDEDEDSYALGSVMSVLVPMDETGKPMDLPAVSENEWLYEDKVFETSNPYSKAAATNSIMRWLYDRAGVDPIRLAANELGLPRHMGEERMKKLNVVELYVYLRANGYLEGQQRTQTIPGVYHQPRTGHLQELHEKIIPRLRMNNIVTTESESELIQTHYYETMFEAVKGALTGMEGLRGTIAAKSSTLRLPIQTESAFAAATDYTLATHEISEGAAIEITTGLYTYKDCTTVKHAVRVGITDEMREDALYPLMELEMDRAAYRLAWVANYKIEKELYDNMAGRAAVLDLADTRLTAANFVDLCQDLAAKKYTPPFTAIIETDHYWSGLLSDTNLAQAMQYGGPEVIRQARIPTLYGCNVLVENYGYLSTATDGPGGFLVKKEYAGVMVERYPPRVENFRDYIHQMDNGIVTWKFVPSYLYTDATTAFQT